MTENSTLKALKLDPQQMFSLVDVDSGEVLGWSETGPDLMTQMAENLTSRPSRFNHLQVMGPGGKVLSAHSR
jgi:hypothetical protein